MAALAQTVFVVGKSGEVMNASKHFVNVFKEARSAYSERKAELKFARIGEYNQKRVQKDFGPLSVASETVPRANSKSWHKDGPTRPKCVSSTQSSTPVMEHDYSDRFNVNDQPTCGACGDSLLPLKSGHRVLDELERSEMGRRPSDGERMSLQTVRRDPRRSLTAADFDANLAYGELPPPLPTRYVSDEDELRGKVTALNRILQEVNCLQHSAKAIIKNLESNPEALAAVALSLAEISSLVAKMAPGALVALKVSAPAVMALLLSPQFLIAVGVGLGVTVVCLGGYKIITKIKAKRTAGASDADNNADELEEIEGVDKITSWRRGISGSEPQSPGTSVEVELMTPVVSKRLRDAGVIPSKENKSGKNGKSSKSAKPAKENKELAKLKDMDEKKMRTKKDKESSGLRLLFKKDKLSA